MNEILTPADVVAELNRLMQESQKGIVALYEAEIKVAHLDLWKRPEQPWTVNRLPK
jgi:hypothetical protein